MRTNVVCALVDVVATKLSIILLLLVHAVCVRTIDVRALVDVVATKLGIVLLSFSFFLLPSTYFSPRRGLPTILNFRMPF